ncbi:MAG: hypothetical protein H7A48_11965, partial [Akkermansiaceae bacterium]|nr:hypothetical protein [Akkermansiaceae bacterium]
DGSFQIFESPDNDNFTEVRTFVNKSNDDDAFSDTLLSSTRFVVFVYTLKNSGNIQLDKLAISAGATMSPSAEWLAFHGLAGFDGDGDHDGLTDLAEYALGALPGTADVGETAPVFAKTNGVLRITAVVRVSDPSLLTLAETTDDLSTSWTTDGVTQLSGVNQDGVPPGFERMVFEVPDGSARRFLRLVFVFE